MTSPSDFVVLFSEPALWIGMAFLGAGILLSFWVGVLYGNYEPRDDRKFQRRG
jgi:hypothetical protein